MLFILMGIVLFAVGALMTVKPYTYWELGHIGRSDAEPPGELYLKIIRIMGIVVLLLAVLVAGISVWPRLSGREVKVSGGENWELAFTEDSTMVQFGQTAAVTNALPYEAACGGEHIYFLGWEVKDGLGTGRPGIYKMPAAGYFAGEAQLLAYLDKSAGKYENLQYEDGMLTWLQQPLTENEKGTAVYQLDLAAGTEPALVCMLTQNVDSYTYHDGKVFLLDGNIEGATLWQWDGTESEKLVKKTLNGGFGVHAEDGWIGAVTKKQDAVIRINLETGRDMELQTSLKPRSVWTGENCVLMACSGGRAAAVKLDGKNAKQYVLKDMGETGLMDMKDSIIWQLDGKVLTVYDMESLTYRELQLDDAAGSQWSLDVSDDGAAVLCDIERNEVYYGKIL